MEHDGRPVGAAVAGAEIDLEGDGEVLAHIDAPRRHRRAGLVACRRQGEDVVRDARAPVRRQRVFGGGGLNWLYKQSSNRISSEVRNVHVPVGSLAKGDGGSSGAV